MKNNISEKEKIIKLLEDKGLYIAKQSDFDLLSSLAGKAFTDYPLDVYLFGGKYDEEALKQVIKANLYSMFDEGIIYANNKEIDGFAVLMPPGYTGTKSLPFLWNGGFWLLFSKGISCLNRMNNFESFAMELKKKYTNNEDWYLYLLCVNKKSQGKKISSKLMKPILDYFKLNKKMCYLETNSDSNVPIYEHFGFKVMEKTIVPNSNVVHYSMLYKEYL